MKEEFIPIKSGVVSMYNCGPTVYGYAHIGNLRSFLANDILRRAFEYAGYAVKQVMNITDIDDKMLKKSIEEGMSLALLARRYEDVFMADLRQLNIKIPEFIPRATEHIGEMVTMIEKLLREGYAYPASDGIYFEVTKASGYGALARLDLAAETEARVEGVADKKSPRDFALWKFWTPEDGPNVFDASFGRGRPGWHIECSAMAMGALGETIDIHTGGIDLIFPHHTNEIAQSEATTGKPFVQHWVHTEFVMVDGQKMSKSLHNTITLADIQKKGFSPIAYRYWFLTAHYRTLVNFTWEALTGAQTALEKIFAHLREYPDGGSAHSQYQKKFLEYISDDLDTPKAVALAWELIKDEDVSDADKKATILDFDTVLGLGLAGIRAAKIPANVLNLARDRDIARKEKDWSKSDLLRDEIRKKGFDVLDTPEGSLLKEKMSN